MNIAWAWNNIDVDWLFIACGLGALCLAGVAVVCTWVLLCVKDAPPVPESTPKRKNYGRQGYWRTNPKGGKGKDQEGNVIHGKTWVVASTGKDTRLEPIGPTAEEFAERFERGPK